MWWSDARCNSRATNRTMNSPCSATARRSRSSGPGRRSYVYEPVGAAFFFARQLDHDATVLVADFGGGTSDFSVMRFSREAGVLKAEPLGHSGIGIAGDTFDYRIVDRVVSPRLGKGGSYRSMDKSPVDSQPLLREFRALEPAGADERKRRSEGAARARAGRARSLRRWRNSSISSNAISASRSTAPSRPPRWRCRAEDEAAVPFPWRGVDIAAASRAGISRAGSPTMWRGSPRRSIRPWRRPASRPAEIERVFLTGGTSFVPAIRRLFVDRFGPRAPDLRRPVRIDRLWTGVDRTERRPRALGCRRAEGDLQVRSLAESRGQGVYSQVQHF